MFSFYLVVVFLMRTLFTAIVIDTYKREAMKYEKRPPPIVVWSCIGIIGTTFILFYLTLFSLFTDLFLFSIVFLSSSYILFYIFFCLHFFYIFSSLQVQLYHPVNQEVTSLKQISFIVCQDSVNQWL